MPKKKKGSLKEARKELSIKPKELDAFISAKGTSTKYYLEDTYEKNKLFRYLLLLRIKGASIDKFLDNHIKKSKKQKTK